MSTSLPAGPQPGSAPSSTGARFALRGLLPSLLLNAVAPLIAYQYLTGRHVSTINALAATAVFPVLGILGGWARTRHLDGIAIISLAFIAVGLATSLIFRDPRLYLVKESFLTGVFGLLCLGSLALPRPLIFFFARQFVSGGDPAAAARFDALWQYPTFRSSQRLTTAVWGVAYLAEALVRLALIFVLPIAVFLVVSPVMAFAVTAALIAWSVAYGQRVRRRGEARRGSVGA